MKSLRQLDVMHGLIPDLRCLVDEVLIFPLELLRPIFSNDAASDELK